MKVHKKLSDLLFRYLLFLFTIVTVIAVIMIGVYMFQSGGPSIAKVGIKNFLFGKTWDTSVEPAKYGILPFLLSSVFSMIGTVVITVPVSILVAVGMSHFIPRPVASVLRTVISMLAGIPSVIYGFLGMILLVPFVQNMFSLPAGLTLLSAIVVLIVMTLPTIISVSESSITAVPEEYMEASLALGVNREYTILHIIVPAAKSGILSAVLLGLGRAVGETMAVIMVAGNVAQMPKLLEPVRFLTTAIVTEMAYASEETSGVLMDSYGIKPMLINTIYTVVLTLIFCIPLGIGSAIYLAEYAKQGKIVSGIRFAIEILAGIPSIVYGLFGLNFFVRKMAIGDYAGSMLSASLTLTLIVLPTMIRTTEESLLAVSQTYREAAIATGMSKFYMIRKIILPCAISGIVVAIILSIGRMVSESAALLYTAGIAQDLPSSVMSHVTEPGATMTVQLYLYATEGGAPEWVPYAMAAVLMVFVLFIEILTHVIAAVFKKRRKG